MLLRSKNEQKSFLPGGEGVTSPNDPMMPNVLLGTLPSTNVAVTPKSNF